MAPPSGVWAHFKKVDNTKRVKCNFCSQELTYCSSTTSLISHLLTKHKVDVRSLTAKQSAKRQCTEKARSEVQEVDPENPQEISTSLLGSGQDESEKIKNANVQMDGPIKQWAFRAATYGKGGKKKDEVDDALLYMIVKDVLPLNTPDKEGFTEFCKKLNPHYKLPCQKTTTASLTKKCNEIKLRIGPLLRTYKNIALTTDIWTETMTVRSFLGVTAHFLSGTEMTSMALGVRLMEQRKTSENIKDLILEILNDWGIDISQIRAIITDRGANIKKACVELVGPEKHLSCFAHILNTVATNAIGIYKKSTCDSNPEVDEPLPDYDTSDDEADNVAFPDADYSILCEIIRKLKKIVTFFRKSEIASTELRELQKKEWMKKDHECLKLIQEVKTRWNSLFLMIERYLLLSEFVSRILIKLTRQKSSKASPPADLNSEEIFSLSEIKDLLHPLFLVTMELSCEKLVTASKCIPLIRMMKTAIETYQSVDPVAFNLKTVLLREIHSFFGKFENRIIYTIATMLDPRFKKIHFENQRMIGNIILKISKLMDQKLQENVGTNSEILEQTPQVRSSNEDSTNLLWKHHYNLVATRTASNGQDHEGGASIELRQFLNTPVSDRKCNPLEEWRNLQSEYPTLYQVALDFLPILSTSVPSERLFSQAGIRLTKLRNRLTGSHLEEQLILSSIPKSIWFGKS